MASATCLLTYSIRRHRIDDYRGRYRVWLGAALACLVAEREQRRRACTRSLADVAEPRHRLDGAARRRGVVARAGWACRSRGSSLRALLDMRNAAWRRRCWSPRSLCYCGERGQLFSATGHRTIRGSKSLIDRRDACCWAIGWCSRRSWPMPGSSCSMPRVWSPFAVEPQPSEPRNRSQPKRRRRRARQPRPSRADRPLGRRLFAVDAFKPAKTPADSSRWVDGSRPERDRYDATTTTTMIRRAAIASSAKSDRKRLRKLKAQGRAA